MANEIHAPYQTGATLYAVILNPANGQVWNGSSFGAIVGASWGTYAVALTQQSTTPIYETSFPAGITAPGNYTVLVYRQAGGSPATTDTLVASGSITWGGAGAAPGDPLQSPVPGAYAQGTAGWALGRIGTGQIVTTSPVAQNGAVTLVAGMDYLAADGRALAFTDATNAWPNLTGAAVTLQVYSAFDGAVQYSKAGTLVSVGGPNQQIRFEPTAADTASFGRGAYHFLVYAVLANGHRADLVRGSWAVVPS